jgi:uncharacterized protein YuzE
MRITYSEDADILFLSFSAPAGKIVSVENENGDILRVDRSSGKIVGVSIQLFMQRIKSGEKIEVPEINFSISNILKFPTMEKQHVNAI